MANRRFVIQFYSFIMRIGECGALIDSRFDAFIRCFDDSGRSGVLFGRFTAGFKRLIVNSLSLYEEIRK